MPRLSKIGAAALAAFGWTGLSSVTASYLQVAGGGGGGFIAGGNRGAGGGAGGYLTGTVSLNPTQSYTVTVGAGGSALTNGSNSQFGTLTASVGGGAGGSQNGASSVVGQNGGSGGGGPSQSGSGSTAGGTGTVGQGNDGAAGSNVSGQPFGCGGGGGAGAVGTLNNNPAGAGGAGLASSITGTSVTYAGGGGGGSYAGGGGAGGAGGAGGGGTGGGTNGNSTSGTANLGGGGGGAEYAQTSGSSGGSGIVIISYVGAQQFGGGVVTSSGGNTIHTFTTSGTLSPLSTLTANFLVVAGGGGGGAYNGGGGGAGGLRSSVTNTGGGGSLESSLTIDTNSIYTVTVGAGGSGQISSTQSVAGSNSSFLSIASIGGGKGGGYTGSFYSASTGGSGGGAPYAAGGPGAAGTANQGFAGGDGDGGTNSGGGGGAGAVGGNATASVGGSGGVGVAVAISGTSTFYAGGGGGAGYPAGGGSAGTGGNGGGGNGGANSAGTSGTANTGGGGGGSQDTNNPPTNAGGNGGSGVVIISYPGSTQQMAGGTVTVAGGNVIHTFTSSGYLTPIVLVNNSLRFRNTITGSPSSPAYLDRTFSAGNQQKWTFSAWIKKTLGRQTVFGRGSTQFGSMQFESNDTLSLNFAVGGTTYFATTTQVFRDPSAWYHLVWAIDTTQSVSTARQRLYVNGTEVTAWSTYTTIPQNSNGNINTANSHWIGRFWESGFEFPFSGYMTEVQFIDGQQLTANSFGSFNGLGVWQPIRYGGSYGTNGFYLPFTNTTSTTTLGYDFSPQGNNWTTNNISLTAGSTYDSMTDVPTLTSATAANYCVWNAIDPSYMDAGTRTISNGNLTVVDNASSYGLAARGTLFVSSAKWYWEINCTNIGSTLGNLGFCNTSNTGMFYQSNGYRNTSASSSNGAAYGASYTTNDVIGVALDLDSNQVTFYKNNVSQGVISISAGSYTPAVGDNGSSSTYTWDLNCGQRPFTYTPPTGFNRLNTFNLPTPTIGATASTTANKYFDAVTYTGAGAGTVITSGFYPDFAWMKNRTAAFSNFVQDSVRGGGVFLLTNTTDADSAISPSSTFSSTGITINGNSSYASNSSYNYVLWAWNANSGSTVTNTNGSINSTVSANTTSGFSIVTYTGNGTNGATIGHGLGVAPNMVIVKERNNANIWAVGSSSLTSWAYYVRLNATNAQSNADNAWNSTAPTSTVFTIGDITGVNRSSGTYVAYCFAQVAGYSAFGSYTGNGSTDGTFIFTGFRPRYFMIKNTSVESWEIFDTSRSPYNQAVALLEADSAGAENNSSTSAIDILSNGFKQRNTRAATNASGNTYIYMAFAENPFKYANAR